jgi:dipeptidyl aminopeptidase/acylaminoacyl peptidase
MKPFSNEDLFAFRSIEDVDCVRGVDLAAFVVLTISRADDTYLSAIWTVPLSGEGQPRQLTAGTAMDDHPRWSPDRQHLAFVSDRGGSPQVYLIRKDGGEAWRASDFSAGVLSFEWAPDGKQLCVIATVKVDPDARGAPSDPPNSDSGPQIAWRLPYKADGLGYLLNQETHLFVFDVERRTSRRMTYGPFEVRSAQWSPDGASIAYTRTRTGRFAHRTDVWLLDARSGESRQLTHDVATTQYPRWSPDGRSIAFGGSAEEGDSQTRPWRVSVDGGDERPIGDDTLELALGQNLYWLPDGETLLAIIARRGRQEVVSIGVRDGAVSRRVTGERHIMQLGVGERLAFASSSLHEPSELYVSDADGRNEKRVTDLNAWWRERAAPRVEARRFDVPDGDGGREQIDGWLILPAQRAPGPLPLVVDVHGGPQSYVDFEYPRHVYWPVLWSRGWAVLALNTVGSSSYGPQFARRLRRRWGELDLGQHLAAIDQLQKEGIADERLAITGKSYGGYLSAWAISKTHRFKAAVVSAPVTNIDSHFGTSDSGYYVTPYAMAGEPQLDRETSRRLSPMETVHQATTPTLILQGKDDERCPICQSEELFATLMRAGETPVEMVLYPGANHHLAERGRPSYRLDYFNRLVDWLERWTVHAGDSDAGDPGHGKTAGTAAGDQEHRSVSHQETAPAD